MFGEIAIFRVLIEIFESLTRDTPWKDKTPGSGKKRARKAFLSIIIVFSLWISIVAGINLISFNSKTADFYDARGVFVEYSDSKESYEYKYTVNNQPYYVYELYVTSEESSEGAVVNVKYDPLNVEKSFVNTTNYYKGMLKTFLIINIFTLLAVIIYFTLKGKIGFLSFRLSELLGGLLVFLGGVFLYYIISGILGLVICGVGAKFIGDGFYINDLTSIPQSDGE